MWRHDQTNDFTHSQLCFLPPRTPHTSCSCWELTPRSPWHHNRGKTSPHFLLRNRCSVQISLQRNAKKKCVRVGFHYKFAKANISRVWKLQNVGPVYECLTLTRTKKDTWVIWNSLICIYSAPYSQNCHLIEKYWFFMFLSHGL